MALSDITGSHSRKASWRRWGRREGHQGEKRMEGVQTEQLSAWDMLDRGECSFSRKNLRTRVGEGRHFVALRNQEDNKGVTVSVG